MSGKWHLGTATDYLPTNHGFDSFYGMGITNVQSCDPNRTIFIQSTLFEFVLMENIFSIYYYVFNDTYVDILFRSKQIICVLFYPVDFI